MLKFIFYVDEQEVDGKLFLSFNSNNEIFDILNLKRSDEKILMECLNFCF